MENLDRNRLRPGSCDTPCFLWRKPNAALLAQKCPHIAGKTLSLSKHWDLSSCLWAAQVATTAWQLRSYPWISIGYIVRGDTCQTPWPRTSSSSCSDHLWFGWIGHELGHIDLPLADMSSGIQVHWAVPKTLGPFPLSFWEHHRRIVELEKPTFPDSNHSYCYPVSYLHLSPGTVPPPP